MENDSLQVMQEDAVAIPVTVTELEAIEKSNIDMQVATAKRYPRNVALAISNAEAMATLDLETAKSCGYALQRQGKTITGPTVHLAKIIASNWGNLRSEARVVGITGKQVISRGICWDLETNNAAAFETRRRITGKDGKIYSDDMVTVTGNAASAIAFRNAVFSVIPRPIVDRIYKKAMQMVADSESSKNNGNIEETAKQWISFFETQYKIKPDELLQLLKLSSAKDFTTDTIVTLNGLHQAIKDGDTTVNELMAEIRGTAEAVNDKKAAMREKKSNKTEMP